MFVGDSITADGWFDENESIYGGTNLLVQQLEAARGDVDVVNSGVGGDQIADIEAAVQTRIINHHPDVVILAVGVNDAGATAPATFRASYDATLAAIQSGWPSAQIVCVGILLYREQWASSPPPAHFSGNPLDSQVEDLNVEIEASAAAHGCTYVDTRTPAAAYEEGHNLPEPGAISGVLTVDGLHPNATGQRLMSDAAFAVFPAFT